MRTFFVFILLICTTVISAQEEIGQFYNTLKTSSSRIKGVIPVVNQENDELAIFISDAKNIYGYKLDSNFNVQVKLTSEEKLRKFKSIIGSRIHNNDNYYIYLTNTEKDRFLSVHFSFKTQETSHRTFTYQDRKERFLQSFNHKNQFYILTYHNIDETVFIYKFEDDGTEKRYELDFSGIQLVDRGLIDASFGKMVISVIEKESLKKYIENDIHSMESLATYRKMFIRDNEVVFIFDQNPLHTQLVTLNLTTLQAKAKKFSKALPKEPLLGKTTNSYLHGNHLFLATASRDRFALKIVNFETSELIKTYTMHKDSVISFKNTPILQVKDIVWGPDTNFGIYAESEYASSLDLGSVKREIETTKQFLRKISRDNLGLSVFKRDGKYEISIGGFKGPSDLSLTVLSSAKNPFFIVNYGPVSPDYYTYIATKSVKIVGLFDKSFDHVEKPIKVNAFDKMNKYNSPLKEAEIVFQYKDFYIKGFYFPFKKLYSFRKFTN